MKPTPFNLAMRRHEWEKLGMSLGFSRDETLFVIAVQSAFNHESVRGLLRGLSKSDLRRVAHGAAILRDEAFRLGGTKKLSINRRKIPRTGQFQALVEWLSDKQSGFQFGSREAQASLKNFSLQQIQNAIAFAIKKNVITVAVPKRGILPGRFAKV